MKSKLINMGGVSRYSAGISFALHVLFLSSAGYLFLPKQLPPQPKPIKLKFIVPPEIKKEEVVVEPQPPKPIEKKVEDVPVQKDLPKSKPVEAAQPINVITTARVTVPDNLPAVRTFPTTETPFTPRSESKGAVVPVQSVARPVDTTALAPRAIQSNFASTERGSGLVAMVASQVKKVSLPEQTFRPAPEITESKPPADPQILKGYLGVIQSKIERAKEYPDIARRAGSQGKVKVQFTILKDGRIENAVLIEKTPHRILNEEALAAVNRAAPFEHLPDEIGKESLSVILPFSFMLN